MFVAGRLLAMVVLLFILSALIFAGTELLPGDAATAVLGREATPQSLAAVREKLGLDEPAASRYFDWLSGLVHGDLGVSLTADRPVTELISGKLRNTIILAVLTLGLMIPLSLGLGLWSGMRADRPVDHVVSGVSLVFISVPEFVTGTLFAVVLAGALDVVPPISLVAPGASPLAEPDVLVLPVLTLLAASLAYSTRMVRAGVIEAATADYVQLARLSGVSERRVVWKHVLRNALAPAVQVIALTASWIFGGVIIVETVFQYPGLGQALVEAVAARDIPFVQSVAMLVAAIYIVTNIVADLLVVFLIPKLRTG
jgi:peptide/nickel transport system permease protein